MLSRPVTATSARIKVMVMESALLALRARFETFFPFRRANNFSNRP